MIKPGIPENEAERLAELYTYNILDTLSEEDYNDITLVAATICKTPISLITFVDDNRQWFKSHKGLPIEETKREYAFCAHALNKPDEMLIVPDSRTDKRFENNPLVTGDPHVIFYTGVPLLTPAGFPLGTLCVIDHEPRELSKEQLVALKVLSKQVITLLEMRKANQALQKAQEELESRNKELEQFASVVSHDIKSPLTGIFLAYQLLKSEYKKSLGAEGMQFLNVMKSSADKINDLVDGILSYYRDTTYFNREEIDMTMFFESIIALLPAEKERTITYPTNHPVISANKIQLEQIFSNLLNNALKYHDKDTVKIIITFSADKLFYYFSIEDNGIGIEEQHHDRIFNLFTKLPTQHLNGKNSYGIGLSTVKKIVETNGGNIRVSSSLGTGSTFTFSLKK